MRDWKRKVVECKCTVCAARLVTMLGRGAILPLYATWTALAPRVCAAGLERATLTLLTSLFAFAANSYPGIFHRRHNERLLWESVGRKNLCGLRRFCGAFLLRCAGTEAWVEGERLKAVHIEFRIGDRIESHGRFLATVAQAR